jgi:hypothetical protein
MKEGAKMLMRQKIGWLALWVTLAFWAGCTGENQNYKINQEQEPLFQERYPTQPNEGASAEPTSEPGPSLDGLERDHWERVAVAPVSGRVYHRPYYFSRHGHWRTWRYSEDRPTPLLAGADIEQQADRVTRGADAGLDPDQIGDGLLGPPKFALDLATLPYQVVRTPPWRTVYTDPGQCDP